MSSLGRRRWAAFKANRRGYWSLRIFLVIFGASLFAEFLANDKPLVVRHEGRFYLPIFAAYAETEFGGVFETEADYREEFVQELVRGSGGWMIWPPVPYAHDTIDYELPGRRRIRRRGGTGWAPTTSARTSWRGSSTASGCPSCSAWCSRR